MYVHVYVCHEVVTAYKIEYTKEKVHRLDLSVPSLRNMFQRQANCIQ